MNHLFVDSIEVTCDTILCSYHVEGEWEKYFSEQRNISIAYSIDISEVPESIAVIPFICNVLPIVWLCDAKLHVKSLDEKFYSHIEQIRQGYTTMYPMLKFGGTVETQIVKNIPVECRHSAAAFFSGGVDAYTTLLRHIDEKPVLMTIWGADIKLNDTIGWNNVKAHTTMVAEQLAIESVFIKSDFRSVIRESKLSKELVSNSGDSWWHGFQHGIGIISHAAPIAYTYGMKKVYIASSYPDSMKGMYTCASNPLIDNHVHFCECDTVHDGCELDRQGKVHYLMERQKELDTDINLRVCWEISGGNNCCRCEKCYRTILEIVSEGGNPNNFGFVWGDKDIKRCEKDIKNKIQLHQFQWDQYYPLIQKMLKKNKNIIVDIEKYQWIQEIDFSNINNRIMKKLRYSVFGRGIRKVMRKISARG
ncbi:MAG: hypothetical protein HDR28_03905 [Lachnospiraceae bacterium]|nr:hypothetical protein [Lachnospiraceae bacterium]